MYKTIVPQRKYPSSLTEQEWLSFFQKGYCVLRGLLNPSEIKLGYKGMDNLFQQAKHLAKQNPSLVMGKIEYNDSLFVLDSSPQGELLRLRRVCGVAEPILYEYSQKTELIKVFSDLLLTPNMEQLICQFHAKKPFDEVEFKPHRDITHRRNYDPCFKDVNGYGSYAIAVIAFDDVNSQNGGLHVVPESHLGIDCSEDITEGWGSEEMGTICPELNKGDVLFMHPYLIHWSSVNNSQESRYSLLSGMACVGANQGVYPGAKTNCIIGKGLNLN